MIKRALLPILVLSSVAISAVLATQSAHAQSRAPDPGMEAQVPPPGDGFDTDSDRRDQPGRVPQGSTTQTPRLSPLPADPSPPSPDARASDDEKGQAAAQPASPPDTPTQRRRALDDLYAHLAASDNAGSSGPLAMAIERLWLYSGSDTIDVLMERVLKAVAEQRLDLAEKLADSIVKLEPGFAEGWNRRALVAYLQGDYENALNALTRALALEPSHFKALDGLAQVMRQRGDKPAALKAYRRLLEVHPYWEGAREAFDELKREVEGDGI